MPTALPFFCRISLYDVFDIVRMLSDGHTFSRHTATRSEAVLCLSTRPFQRRMLASADNAMRACWFQCAPRRYSDRAAAHVLSAGQSDALSSAICDSWRLVGASGTQSSRSYCISREPGSARRFQRHMPVSADSAIARWVVPMRTSQVLRSRGCSRFFRWARAMPRVRRCGIPGGWPTQAASNRPMQIASAGNRTRVTSMATMYSTTRPLMLLEMPPSVVCPASFF